MDPEPEPVHDDLIPVWITWHNMNASRPVGMGVGMVPLSEIAAELDEMGLIGAMRSRWLRLLRAMDVAFVSLQNEKKEERRANLDSRTADRRKPDGAGRGAGKRGPQERRRPS